MYRDRTIDLFVLSEWEVEFIHQGVKKYKIMIYSSFVASIFDNLLLVFGTYYLIVFFSYKIKDACNWFISNTG